MKGAEKTESLIPEKRVKVKRSFFDNIRDDLVVLKSIWFAKKSNATTHAERLEDFYKPQAKEYDNFRSRFLWAREPMLSAMASRVTGRNDLVWVDLGGGTGENVELMAEEMPMASFKAIYIVDLCHSLCEQAKLRFKENPQFSNVHVVEGDACTFQLPEGVSADIVTFSYSLSMIPPFHAAVDNAHSLLNPETGFLSVCDFGVSQKYDEPQRQMGWARRMFWCAVFDIDGIFLGPERRAYLDHVLVREHEQNGQGSIPYVPYFRAPWYIWIGKPKQAK